MTTVYIITCALQEADVCALRAECDVLMRNATGCGDSLNSSDKYLSDKGAALDIFESARISPDSTVRTDPMAYMAERWKLQPEGTDASREAIRCVILEKLPSIVKYLTCDVGGGSFLNNSSSTSSSCCHNKSSSSRSKNGIGDDNTEAGGRMYLFNEHYVVKPAHSELVFRWHTDGSAQLAALAAAGGREKQGEKEEDRGSASEAAVSPLPHQYWSLWCPLDDVSADNGTLVFPSSSFIVKLGTQCVPIDII